MSYEYVIIIDSELHYEKIWSKLSNSHLAVCSSKERLAMKDAEIASSWDYDLVLHREVERKFLLEIVIWSEKLYQNFSSPFKDIVYKIFEDGDTDCQVSMEDVFRIKDT